MGSQNQESADKIVLGKRQSNEVSCGEKNCEGMGMQEQEGLNVG